MKPRIRLSPMSSPVGRLWVCGVIGSGRTVDEAYESWRKQVTTNPDLRRFANG